MIKFKDVSLEEIKVAILESNTIAKVLYNLGCHDNTSNRNKLKETIEQYGFDISHFKTKLTKEVYEKNPKLCKHCGKIISYEKRNNDFCSHSCAASINNIGVTRNGTPLLEHSYCLNCKKEITRGNKYCNNTCKAEYERKEYIKRWKAGEETGVVGVDNIATAVRIYLREKYNNSCQICGWNEVNPYTGIVPL